MEPLTHDEAVTLVQRIMDCDYQSDDECDRWLDRLDRDLRCNPGLISGMIFWPDTADLTAEQIVKRAEAYRPIAL